MPSKLTGAGGRARGLPGDSNDLRIQLRQVPGQSVRAAPKVWSRSFAVSASRFTPGQFSAAQDFSSSVTVNDAGHLRDPRFGCAPPTTSIELVGISSLLFSSLLHNLSASGSDISWTFCGHLSALRPLRLLFASSARRFPYAPLCSSNSGSTSVSGSATTNHPTAIMALAKPTQPMMWSRASGVYPFSRPSTECVSNTHHTACSPPIARNLSDVVADKMPTIFGCVCRSSLILIQSPAMVQDSLNK